MKALRQRVETIVRPIRASHRTKDRMRDELLAHLESLYAQALEHSNDESAALAEATRQLGEAGELTGELQASVSVWEEWAFQPLPGSRWAGRRSGESIRAWILRMTAASSLASGLSVLLVVTVLAGIEHRFDRWQVIVPFLLVVPLLQWFSLASIYGVCELMRREVDGEAASGRVIVRHLRVAGLLVLYMVSGMIAPAVLALMYRSAVAHPVITNGQIGMICLIWASLLGGLLVVQFRDWRSTIRRYDLWDSLELDPQAAS